MMVMRNNRNEIKPEDELTGVGGIFALFINKTQESSASGTKHSLANHRVAFWADRLGVGDSERITEGDKPMVAFREESPTPSRKMV